MVQNGLTRKARKALYREASKFFVDVAKLVFAGVIIAGIMKEDIDLLWLVGVGLASVVLSLAAGYKLFELGNS